MSLIIQTPHIPSRLILAWEAPKSSQDRRRWAIGELTNSSAQAEFRYYLGQEFSDKNYGRSYEELTQIGYAGVPGFYPELRAEPFLAEAIESFRRRLPPEKRSDFKQYLEYYGLEADSEISSMSLLGVTGARLPSDGFELIDPLTTSDSNFEVVIEITGYSHYLDNAANLYKGAKLSLEAEPINIYDPNAIAFKYDAKTIGYVNRLQNQGLKWLLTQRNIESFVMRLNGTQNHPRAYAFVRVRSNHKKAAA